MNTENVMLSNGVTMPALTYGIEQLSKEDVRRAIPDALKAGYRSFAISETDDAVTAEIGKVLANTGVPRDDLFLTTGVWLDHYGDDGCRKAVAQTLKLLQTDYIDLMLLPQIFSDDDTTWQTLETLYEEGVLRAIGVYHFPPDALITLASSARIIPMVSVQALGYSSAAAPWMAPYDMQCLLDAPYGAKDATVDAQAVTNIAQKYHKTPAQITLRYQIERGSAIVTQTTDYADMVQSTNIFDFTLTPDDMASLSAVKSPKDQTVINGLYYKTV